MKNIALSLMLAGGLVLGACSQTQQQQTIAEIEAIIGQVQQDAAVACKYIPTVATIVGLLNAAAGATAATITSAVCAAITATKPASAVSTPTMVGKVVVNGWRVQ